MKSFRNSIEPLEARIAPAALTGTLPHGRDNFVKATLGGATVVPAGHVLTTGAENSGSYLLFVEQGTALVYTTDLNNNGEVDFNEVTGIAAGDGLRMTSFVDIHGDIVTNLKKVTRALPGAQVKTFYKLSDSNSTTGDDDPTSASGGDGRVLLNTTIEKIELRGLTPRDVGDISGPLGSPDGVADQYDVAVHQPITTTSIFGTIYAGKGFGTADGKGGLIINADTATNFGEPVIPTIGSIKTGTAANGEFFSFGASNRDDVSGYFTFFSPLRGQAGGDINGVHSVGGNVIALNLDTLHAGDGGPGARGGNVANVALTYDDSGGYTIIAGNGGNGPNGGNGGSILNFSDIGSITGSIFLKSGDGGVASTGAGGNGGDFTFTTFNVRGDITLTLGDGGAGFVKGGNGASLATGVFTQPDDTVGYRPGSIVGSTHWASSKPIQFSETLHGTANNQEVQTFAPPSFLQRDTYFTLEFGGDRTAPISVAALQNSGDPAQDIEDLLNGLTHISQVGGVQVQTSVVSPSGYDITFNSNGDRPFITGALSPRIGTQQGIDFDGDGLGDFALSTLDTSQVNIVFGDVGKPILHLPGVRNAEAMVVADLDADGHPDLAVASQDTGSQEGVVVFLAQYDANDHFVGFRSPRFSVLPQIASGDPDVYGGSTFGYVRAPNQVSTLNAGDFNGDGRVELALTQTSYSTEHTDQYGQVDDLNLFSQVLIYLEPDVEVDNLTGASVFTGQFYADFGTRAFHSDQGDVPADPQIPFYSVSYPGGAFAGTTVAEASPLTIAAGYDVMFVAARAANLVHTIDYSQRNGFGAFEPGVFNLGAYDSDRQLGADHIDNSSKFLVQDFSVTDLDRDGIADLVAIDASPQYVIAVLGNGDGTGQMTGLGADNAGVYYGDPAAGIGGFGLLTAGSLLAVETGDFDHDGRADDVYVLDNLNNTGTRVTYLPGFVGSAQTAGGPPHPLVFSEQFTGATASKDVAFDIAYSTVPQTQSAVLSNGPLALAGNLVSMDYLYLDSPFNVLDYGHTGLVINAGDGGDSLIGRAGNGGALGGGPLGKGPGTGPNSVVGKLDFIYAGDVVLTAGSGGDGFSVGGNAGDVSGVKLRYRGGSGTSDVGLGIVVNQPTSDNPFPAHGGRAVSGQGGQGGSIISNSLETSLPNLLTATGTSTFTAYSVTAIAGNGGDGGVGGRGGSIVGNLTTAFDAVGNDIVARAGKGGNGPRLGGNGGSVLDFHPFFPPPTNITGSLENDGTIQYIAGNGGHSVAGRGGDGGDILRSQPSPNAFIDLPVILTGGDAGDGLVGGEGGSVSGFQLLLFSKSASPNQVTVHGGNGGLASQGRGGDGGSILAIDIPSRGTVGLNSAIAGNGGISAGSAGGTGGSIVNVTMYSTQNAVALAAGAGGSGLIRGGDGGAVQSVSVQTGSSTFAKVLVIAGAGGDAYAFLPNTGTINGQPNDDSPNQAEKAFGGTIGRGGNGGTINGVSQSLTEAGNQGAHFDLIAGNGGSTVNFGTLFDTKNYVGSGGSVLNITLTGDFGNIVADNPQTADNSATPGLLESNENVPIKSYNDSTAGETVADFVKNNLRNPVNGLDLTDSLGNVGIVVGAAGRNKAVLENPIDKPETFLTQPAGADPQNGSLINVRGHNLLAAVAGSVDAIASIQYVKNVFIDFVAGADKGVYERGSDGQPLTTNLALDFGIVGRKDFILDNGQYSSNPEIGGKLIDGWVVAKEIAKDAQGNLLFSYEGGWGFVAKA